eukprot:6182519-Pleurochrysis_carterae.AAC.1
MPFYTTTHSHARAHTPAASAGACVGEHVRSPALGRGCSRRSSRRSQTRRGAPAPALPCTPAKNNRRAHRQGGTGGVRVASHIGGYAEYVVSAELDV